MTASALMAAVCFARDLRDGRAMGKWDLMALVALAEAAGAVPGEVAEAAEETAEVPAAKKPPTCVPCVGSAFAWPLRSPSTSE